MLALCRRAVLLRPARRALLSTAASGDAAATNDAAADGAAFDFASLAEDNGQLLPAAVVTKRLLGYLQVDPKDLQRVLSAEELRPLPYKALFAPKQVQLLTPLVRWGFQQLKDDSMAADAVFSALQPHANMARGAVWRKYYQRQFFLSEAPLKTYLQAYNGHRKALAARTQAAAQEEEGEEEEDVDEDEEEDADDELTAAARSNQVATDSRRKKHPIKSKGVTVLADDKKWDWVPLHVASSVVKEFCFRGRFAEAIEAYASLPLTDAVRRDVVAILQDYEQYPSLLYLFEVHRSMGCGVQPLDVAAELDALKKVGRTEEMDTRFQELPAKEQSRADIQQLMGN